MAVAEAARADAPGGVGAAGAAETPAGPSPQPAADAPPGLAQGLRQLLDDLLGVVHARAQLLALETQRAGIAVTRMALYAVLAALLAVTVWACFWVLLIAAAALAGVPLVAVLAAALGLSALGVWLLLRRIRAEARHLLFPATLRRLPAAAPAGEPAAAGRGQARP